jgi:hypothetical protein
MRKIIGIFGVAICISAGFLGTARAQLDQLTINCANIVNNYHPNFLQDGTLFWPGTNMGNTDVIWFFDNCNAFSQQYLVPAYYQMLQNQQQQENDAATTGTLLGILGGMGGVRSAPQEVYRQPAYVAPRPVVQAPQQMVAPRPVVQAAPQMQVPVRPGLPTQNVQPTAHAAMPVAAAPAAASAPIARLTPVAPGTYQNAAGQLVNAQGEPISPRSISGAANGCSAYGSTNLACYQAGYLTRQQYEENVRAGVP